MTRYQRPLLVLLAGLLSSAAAQELTVSCTTEDAAACDTEVSFCQLFLGEGCTGAGTCAVVPEYCIEIYLPVCGCDGATYGNECLAHNARVNVASEGECTPLELECPSLWDPVCGSDGVTYSSACHAGKAGVDVVSEGECDVSDAMEADAKYYVACGKGNRCREGDVLVANAVEDHAVRCCADGEVSGWKKRNGCAVWAGSDVEGCHTTTHAAAAEHCAGVVDVDGGDARLCTREELTAKCTKGTGCGFDRHLVWSGSPAAPGHHVVCGKGAGCVGGDAAVAPDDQLHEVRCCSNTSLPGWTKRGGCDVWTESVFDGGCHHNKSYDEAQGICAGAEGRLCTKEELEAQCTMGTGCGHDKDLIWSSTVG